MRGDTGDADQHAVDDDTAGSADATEGGASDDGDRDGAGGVTTTAEAGDEAGGGTGSSEESHGSGRGQAASRRRRGRRRRHRRKPRRETPRSTKRQARRLERAERRGSGRNLPLAIAVGIGLAAIFLGALFYNAIAFTVAIGLLTTIAYAETRRVLATVGHRIDVPVLIVATFVMLFGAYQARHAGQILGVLVLVAGAFVWHAADPLRTRVLRSAGATVLFGLWVGFLASFAVLLINRPSGGVAIVLAVVGAAVLSDVGAFAVGVKFGRHKIAPVLSPNKTWEGLAGGVVTATVAGAAGLPFLDGPFTILTGGIVAFACAVAAFGGDLVESMIKRDVGVKDLGEVLPGHGGILDRVDGILVALPVGFYVVELVV